MLTPGVSKYPKSFNWSFWLKDLFENKISKATEIIKKENWLNILAVALFFWPGAPAETILFLILFFMVTTFKSFYMAIVCIILSI